MWSKFQIFAFRPLDFVKSSPLAGRQVVGLNDEWLYTRDHMREYGGGSGLSLPSVVSGHSIILTITIVKHKVVNVQLDYLIKLIRHKN